MCFGHGELSPLGKFIPGPRLGKKELEAIRRGYTWDSDVETLNTAQTKWMAAKAKQNSVFDITFSAKKKGKGKQKEEDNDNDNEDEEEIQFDEEGNVIPPVIKLSKFWVDIATTKDIVAHINMVGWRMALKDVCTALIAFTKKSVARENPPLPPAIMR